MKRFFEQGAHTVQDEKKESSRFRADSLRPYRKIFHLSGSGIALLYFFTIDEKGTALLCLAPLLLFFLIIDLVRLASPRINNWIFKHFHLLIHEREQKRPCGSTYYLIGSFLSILLFEKEIAVASILFLSLGDPLASLFGSKLGRLKVWGKTVEGSLAFLLTAFLVGIFFFALPVAFSAALAAAATELLPLKPDDNLYIPLIAGAVLSLLV